MLAFDLYVILGLVAVVLLGVVAVVLLVVLLAVQAAAGALWRRVSANRRRSSKGSRVGS